MSEMYNYTYLLQVERQQSHYLLCVFRLRIYINQ